MKLAKIAATAALIVAVGAGVAKADVSGIPVIGPVGPHCAKFDLLTGSGTMMFALPLESVSTGPMWAVVLKNAKTATFPGAAINVQYVSGDALPCVNGEGTDFFQPTIIY